MQTVLRSEWCGCTIIAPTGFAIRSFCRDTEHPPEHIGLGQTAVEAPNSKGELFSFDRTRSLGGLSAEEIARAAESFGQEDEITVLTLQRSVPA